MSNVFVLFKDNVPHSVFTNEEDALRVANKDKEFYCWEVVLDPPEPKVWQVFFSPEHGEVKLKTQTANIGPLPYDFNRIYVAHRGWYIWVEAIDELQAIAIAQRVLTDKIREARMKETE